MGKDSQGLDTPYLPSVVMEGNLFHMIYHSCQDLNFSSYWKESRNFDLVELQFLGLS